MAPALERRTCQRAYRAPAARHNGLHYKAINILNLWLAASAAGYDCPIWLTYRQSQELGGQVRKGEKGEMVVYANSVSKTEVNAKGEEVERDIHFLKRYTVFNSREIDNLSAHFYATPDPPVSSLQRIEKAEAYFKATGAVILHGAATALFMRPDRIVSRCRR